MRLVYNYMRIANVISLIDTQWFQWDFKGERLSANRFSNACQCHTCGELYISNIIEIYKIETMAIDLRQLNSIKITIFAYSPISQDSCNGFHTRARTPFNYSILFFCSEPTYTAQHILAERSPFWLRSHTQSHLRVASKLNDRERIATIWMCDTIVTSSRVSCM